MCLITRFPKILTKKDLVVYKVLMNDLTSPWYHYQYPLDSLIISDFKISDVYLIDGRISSTYARYILPYEAMKLRRNYSTFNTYVQDLNLNLQVVENGLHSFRTLADAIEYEHLLSFKWFSTQIYKAVIPAGSALYINYKQIVSNQLIIKNKI